MKKVLLITTSNISMNPRLYKELLTYLNQGFKIHIVCFSLSNWSDKLDDKLRLQDKEVEICYLKAGRKPLINWILFSIIQWVSIRFYSVCKKSVFVSSIASNKRTLQLYFKLKSIKKFDYSFISAHNLGTLYVAAKMAEKNKVPFIFDVEDYHPGEYIFSDAINEKQRREYLLKRLLPQAACVTVASPLIGENIKALLGEIQINKMVLINNCFLSSEFVFNDAKVKNVGTNQHVSKLDDQKINFVWFSQSIAANRGLELIIPKLTRVSNRVHLHLIGNLYSDFNREWIEPNFKFITTYSPMQQEDLNRFICQFDVGLALELSSFDQNRQICLTNKIWAYMQAGLYILATDTSAQMQFIKEHGIHGMVFKADEIQKQEFLNIEKNIFGEQAIDLIIKNIDNIRQAKFKRYQLSKEFSWDVEREKLVRIFNSLLSK
ncbi:MAG: hypothetical protein NTY07_16225 [Bacteroidia bacterium]|nr:hypothetical protein [Bacteroidia bacterium]